MAVWKRLRNSLYPKHNYEVKPFGFRWRSHTLFIVATVGVGMFTDLFLYGLVVPVLPFLLQDRLRLPHSEVQIGVSGLLSVYAISSVAICPIAGFISDKLNSRQGPFLFGLVALMLSTILMMFGTTMPVLVIARIFQGASSAAVWTVGIALAVDTVGPENLGKTIGTLFSFCSIGELFSPPLGGMLYKKWGTNAVLAVSLALLGVDFIMRLFVIEKGVAARYEAEELSNSRADHGRGGAQPDGNVAASNEDNTANGDTNQQSENTPLLQESQGKIPPEEDDAYLVPEGRSALVNAAPILYPLMHSSSIAAANFLTFFQAFLLAAYDATVATHAEELYGFDSLKAGLLFIPMALVNMIVGPLGGWAVDRYGAKLGAVVGLSLQVPVFVLLRLPKARPYPQQAILWAALLGLLGIGGSISGSTGMVEAGTELEKYHKRNPKFFGPNGPYAQLYAGVSMMFNLGLAVGPLVSGDLKDRIGYGNMNACMAGVAALAVVVSFVWLGGPPRLPWKKS